MNDSGINQPVAALRLTIFIGDSDCWHHKPLSAEIVDSRPTLLHIQPRRDCGIALGGRSLVVLLR